MGGSSDTISVMGVGCRTSPDEEGDTGPSGRALLAIRIFDARQATCSNQADWERLMGMIEGFPGGREVFNAELRAALTRGIAHTQRTLEQDAEADSDHSGSSQPSFKRISASAWRSPGVAISTSS
jgi:hypothetical protein